MRKNRTFGRFDADVAYPSYEGFACRATQLGSALKLCSYCLHSNTRCADSQRRWPKSRSWKRYRAHQRRQRF